MLQEIPKGNTVPVLFLSGQVEEFHNAKEMMPNAIDLVSKPIKIKELIKYVDDYFKKQSVSRHPIFTGDLGTIDIWQLLKNIESNGVNGTIEIQRKDGKNVEFTLNKGMLDEVHLLNEDGDDPISYLIDSKDGTLTVYQELATIAKPSQKAKLKTQSISEVDEFTIPHADVNPYEELLNFLTELMTKMINKIGRQDTLKTFIKVVHKNTKDFIDLRFLNVNYKGQVTWEGDKEILHSLDFVNIISKLVLDLIIEVGLVAGDMFILQDFFPEKNPQLEEINFYDIYDQNLS
jgi:CheY-like chemotaxis protein